MWSVSWLRPMSSPVVIWDGGMSSLVVDVDMLLRAEVMVTSGSGVSSSVVEGAYFAWWAEYVFGFGGFGAAETCGRCCSWMLADEVASWAHYWGDFGCYRVLGWVTAAAVLVEGCVKGVDFGRAGPGITHSVFCHWAGECGVGCAEPGPAQQQCPSLDCFLLGGCVTQAVSEMTQTADTTLKLSNCPADEVKNCLGGGKMIGQT